ncbi:MAG: hypothetical protein KAU31_05100, partial [Spirochaetaceae bacterium]|nr:hypothetical protein [Spirochaetaceae bacterium]
SIANSLWPQTGARLVDEFLELAESYEAEVLPVDYRRKPDTARKEINAWAEEKTNGRIMEIVNWDLHRETHLLLANAIYFKGNWASQFNEAATMTMPFHLSETETIEVPMMMQMGHFRSGHADGAGILELPYDGDELSMIIVLPWEIEGLHSIEERMTADDLVSWQTVLYEEIVEVYLPRFRITSAFDLVKDQDLAALGMSRALDMYDAEFSGVGEPSNWFSIQRFVHKAFVDVNEEGTEAVAVTVGGCFPAGTPVLTPDGLKPIETVDTGTAVCSFDLAAGQWVTTRVASRHAYQFSGGMIAIQVGTDTIEATWNHPFLVVRGDGLNTRRVPMDLPTNESVTTTHGRWVEARDLKPSDLL